MSAAGAGASTSPARRPRTAKRATRAAVFSAAHHRGAPLLRSGNALGDRRLGHPRAQHPGAQEWSDYTPTAAMVAEVDSELREIHHVRYTPTPYAAAYVDWSVDPYGGGANYWNIHARSPD